MREQHGRKLRGKDKVPFATFVWALVVQALSSGGSLGHHVRAMSGVSISEAAVQERREGLRWTWFEALFAHILHPLAQAGEHAESFYHGLRLLAVDGSKWSLRNTASLLAQSCGGLPRNQKQAGAAFLKWGTAVLLEVGTHQPLAAACAQMDLGHEEGEMNIARRVLCAIPRDEDMLLLGDRLYGCGRFICDVRSAAGPRCEVLVRISSRCRGKVLKSLSDGSAIIEVNVNRPGSTRVERTLQVREVRGQVWRAPQDGTSGKARQAARTDVRLWTTLLDEREHPGVELLALYARRWEQELFFRELKMHTGREHLLRAGGIAGAEAEFGALIIAASLLAAQRLKAARQVELPPTRLSITKISRAMEALLPVLSVAGEVISARQRALIVSRFMEHTAKEARIPPRRARSCQRGLRKPVCAWPRIRSRQDLDGACFYALTTISFP